MNVLAQIADGLSYFVKQAYVHCDVACRNVLVTDKYLFKIADYSLAGKLVKGPKKGDLPFYQSTNRVHTSPCYVHCLILCKHDQ